MNFHGKTVLITGASMGIGEAFARELSRRGATLLLVARGEAKLQALAAELGNAHVFAVDLAQPGAPKRIHDAVMARGLAVDVLINNAGFGRYGPFESLPFEEQHGQVALNVSALVELTYLFIEGITQRQGGVINVASIAAYLPTPYMAVYGATKAFVLSFSEALWGEYRSRGVRVLCLNPGQTETAFFDRAVGLEQQKHKARPEDVVRLGLEAFAQGRASVIHGQGNRLLTGFGRLFPRALVARVGARMFAPRPTPATLAP